MSNQMKVSMNNFSKCMNRLKVITPDFRVCQFPRKNSNRILKILMRKLFSHYNSYSIVLKDADYQLMKNELVYAEHTLQEINLKISNL